MNTLVSIIIPCYNAKKFIVNTLKSVESQDYKNYECIIINDGSTDNTEATVKEYIKNDTRFKLVTQNNKGLSATRNRGIDLAEGDYIYFLDADDLLDSKTLSNLLKLTNDEIAIVFGKTAITQGHNTIIKSFLQHAPITDQPHFNNNKSLIPLVINYPLICIACNRLYSVSFLKANKLKFKENLLHEDELWHFETLFHANAIILSNETTYYYNKGNSNSITNNFTLKNTQSYLKIINYIYQNYYLNKTFNEHQDITSTYITYLQIITIRHCYKLTPKLLKPESESLICESFNTIRPKKQKRTLSKKNENAHKLFKKIMHLDLETISTFMYYQRSRSIRKWFKKQYMLIQLNFSNR